MTKRPLQKRHKHAIFSAKIDLDSTVLEIDVISETHSCYASPSSDTFAPP